MHRKKSDEAPELTGRLVGYARVSTADQDVAMQVAALRKAGVQDDNIWFETVSGVKKKRPQRDMALLDARKGDVFVVYKLDRLGRSFLELLEMVEKMERRGVGFRSLTEGFDTTTPGGRLLFHVLGALAEFERGLIAERTRDGMANAKREGRKLGAPLFMTPERIKEAKQRLRNGESVRDIVVDWNKTPQMLYRYIPRKTINRLRKSKP
jgi:DNA invertase Pin-like site-specific DNA recombinase